MIIVILGNSRRLDARLDARSTSAREGVHLETLRVEWHWDLEIYYGKKVIATTDMTTNTKKKMIIVIMKNS